MMHSHRFRSSRRNGRMILAVVTAAALSMISVVDAVLPTAGIDIFMADSYHADGNGKAKAVPMTTMLASQASFGTWPDMKGKEKNSPTAFTPVLPPTDDTLLCRATDAPKDKYTYYKNTDAMLVGRGTCSFELKAYNAQLLGAGAVMVYGTLGSRYSYNATTSSIRYPTDKWDYDCDNGQADISTSSLDLTSERAGYNADVNDAQLFGSQSLCAQKNPAFMDTCASGACLLTGNVTEYGTQRACCAWDMHVWLFNDPALEKNLTEANLEQTTIPALYLTLEQGQELLELMGDSESDGSDTASSSKIVLTIYQRWRPTYNSSAVIVWAVGVFVAWMASYMSASDYRTYHKWAKQVGMQSDGDEEAGGSQRGSPARGSGALKRDEDREEHQHQEESQSALMTELIPGTAGYKRTGEDEASHADTQMETSEQGAGADVATDDANAPTTSYAYGEETLELTWHHAIAFLCFSSMSLFILFYFKIYAVVKIMYGIGCSGALSQVVMIPLFEYVIAKQCKQPQHSYNTSATPKILFHFLGEPVTLVDFLAVLCGYSIGITWIIIGFTVKPDPSVIAFYWIVQDIFGACMCITFLSVIRLNSIKVATILLMAAFLYDIFFVFITPLIFSSSIMITVATSGGPPTADPTFCEKYPLDANCQGGEPLPMLFAIPRLFDYQGGSSLLGLGDIVLPGLLLSLACRLDNAKRVVGGGRNSARGAGCCGGYFYPTVVAYGIGLMMANVAVYVMQMGQPALLYLVPMCLGTFSVIGWRNSEFKDLWEGPTILKAADRIVHPYGRDGEGGQPAAQDEAQGSASKGVPLALPAEDHEIS